ncbi:glucosyltransferase [Toensbergia leucococca]|nr:glucosyltransferase [Toensbergia leucococca]
MSLQVFRYILEWPRHFNLYTYAVVVALASFWMYKINITVPEPYLDEYFHIGQAEQYWLGHWESWDPKITTPPGLYLISYPWLMLQTFLRTPASITADLRSVNVIFGAFFIFPIVRKVIDGISDTRESLSSEDLKSKPRWSSLELDHATVNICLFPPLSFFYGLYYTDVLAALVALYTYAFYLKRRKNSLVGVGLLSLLFRQTNIFWVAVFLGALEVSRTIPKGRSGVEFQVKPSFYEVVAESWRRSCHFDPLVSQAGFEDYIKSDISLVAASLANLPVVLRSIVPYLILLSTFGLFILWNSGVVLGDKENHIASIHLSQMLYIWPYFMFFSFPFLGFYLLNSVSHRGRLNGLRSSSTKHQVPRLVVTGPVLAVMLAVVHFNTVIHPFTLADNRHYIFYVFRHLLRHPAIKYCATPVYFVCAWAAIGIIGGLPDAQHNGEYSTGQSLQSDVEQDMKGRKSSIICGLPDVQHHGEHSTTQSSHSGVGGVMKGRKVIFSNRPKTGCMTCRRRKKKCDQPQPECSICLRDGFICVGYTMRDTEQKLNNEKAPISSERHLEKPIAANQELELPHPQPPSTQPLTHSTTTETNSPFNLPPNPTTTEPGTRTSFLLAWLLATTLSLITAPLVEPRYFIMPWLIWRLHLPPRTRGGAVYTKHDYRLWLETAWFLLVNLVTGYVFLNRGFEWAQEPGLVQRFMW